MTDRPLSEDDQGLARRAQFNGWEAIAPCMGPNDNQMWGLTKRELFAAMALQGWLAGCSNAYSEFTDPGRHSELVAGSCVALADALLKELAK